MLSIRTTGACRAAAMTLLLALLLPDPAARGQAPVSAHRFPVTPRATVVLDTAPFGPPAIGGGRVYVAYEAGQLAAHRLSDGTELWRIDLPLEHPPVAIDDLVLTMAGGALHARHAVDGGEVWRFDTAALAAPLLAHQGWIVLAPAHRLVALRAVDGSVVWSRDNPTLVDRPAIEGNRLYAPLADGRLQALDLRTGEPLWTRRLGGPPTSVLAFADRVYAGSADRHFYCLRADTGQELWRFHVGSALRGAPAAHETLVHTVALDNLVRAHDRRGHRVWNQGIPYRAFAGPIVVGPILAVAGPSPDLQLFDAASGAPQAALPFDAPLIAPVAVATDDRHAVLAAFTGSLAAGWRLVLLDSAYSVPLAPLTALPGEPIPLWTPGK